MHMLQDATLQKDYQLRKFPPYSTDGESTEDGKTDVTMKKRHTRSRREERKLMKGLK